MNDRRRLRCVVIATAAWLAVAPAGAAPQARHQVYITAVDTGGRPVPGLGPADVVIDLDGTRQEVLGVAPTSEAPSVIILTDRLGLNSTYTAYDVKTVLAAFVASVVAGAPAAKFSLMTFDGTAMAITRFSTPPAELDRALGRLATSSADAVLLDALADAARAMTEAPTARRIIFAVASAYRPDQSNAKSERVMELLRLSGASLWAIEVRQAGGANFGSVTREYMLDAGSQWSGGARVTVASRTGLEAAAAGMAALFAAQYVVTYGPGGGTGKSRLTIGVVRPGVTVLGPRWVPAS